MDMRLDPEQQKDICCPPVMAEEYPHGLRLYLNSEELAKLGIDKTLQVGEKFKMLGECVVVGVNLDDVNIVENKQRVDLQITDLEMKQDGEIEEGKEEKEVSEEDKFYKMS